MLVRNRFSNALAISDGACNPSGIALAFADACRQACDEGADTPALCADPALRLMAYQLAYLMGVREIENSLTLFSELRDRCSHTQTLEWLDRRLARMNGDKMTLNEFVASTGISLTSTRVHSNPNMLNSDNMDNWCCVLRVGRSRMTVVFSKGIAHNGKAPDVSEVLDSLMSDSSYFENARDFEDFASELGYDPDSRKAFRLFQICGRQAARLRKFLGESAYKTLLWNVERE